MFWRMDIFELPSNPTCKNCRYLLSLQNQHFKIRIIWFIIKNKVSKSAICVSAQHQRVVLSKTKIWKLEICGSPFKKQVPNFGHIRFSSNPILKVGQNRTFEVVHFCLFIKTQIAKLEILASSKTRGCFFVLFSGYHVRASFGFEAVRPRHKEKGLGVRGVAKTKFQRSRNYHCSKDIF